MTKHIKRKQDPFFFIFREPTIRHLPTETNAKQSSGNSRTTWVWLFVMVERQVHISIELWWTHLFQFRRRSFQNEKNWNMGHSERKITWKNKSCATQRLYQHDIHRIQPLCYGKWKKTTTPWGTKTIIILTRSIKLKKLFPQAKTHIYSSRRERCSSPLYPKKNQKKQPR